MGTDLLKCAVFGNKLPVPGIVNLVREKKKVALRVGVPTNLPAKNHWLGCMNDLLSGVLEKRY